MKQVRLGIAGLGTVAQGALDILAKNGELIAQRTGVELVVSRVASRSPKPGVDLLGGQFTQRVDDLLGDDVDVVLELIGGEDQALELIERALDKGKAVVTANKAVIAQSGNELLSRNPQVCLKYEAAVAGAIPIIQAIQTALVANEFHQVVGIINGTCNYILTAMQERGQAFADALADAQALGYAEADPTFDVEGIDAAHKLTILAALAFDTPFQFDQVFVEGISHVTAKDIEYADELGYRIKHVGIAQAGEGVVEARVHPALIPKEALLANVNDVANAVVVRSDAAGQTLYSGPGAGGSATASAVLGDVLDLATSEGAAVPSSRGLDAAAGASRGRRYLDISEVHCSHYLRIPVRDQSGVFAQVANTLSEHDISIEAALQKEPSDGNDAVDIVILTHQVREDVMDQALRTLGAKLAELDVARGDVSSIRVEALA
jgi:homoserine dehydrogenase